MLKEICVLLKLKHFTVFGHEVQVAGPIGAPSIDDVQEKYI